MNDEPKTLWFTICARNYLGYALTLYHSLKDHHPDADFTVFLADEPFDDLVDAPIAIENFPFTIIPAKSLALDSFADMTVRYDVMELATAIKPACFLYAFDTLKARRAIYLDPDIYITAPPGEITHALGTHDLLLTPHICGPYTDEFHPDDRQILKAGTFNLGFAAMADCADVRLLLEWWQGKLARDGHNDIENGQFVDQRYMDLAPSFVERTKILRHRGLNAAYWNLHERPITLDQDQSPPSWRAGNDPLIFFHFSGIVPGDLAIFSKHQNRFSLEAIGELAQLHQTYLAKLDENHQADFSSIAYAYDEFSSGEPISPLMRRVYARTIPMSEAIPPGSSVRVAMKAKWFTKTDPNTGLPVLMAQAWAEQADLQKAFDLSTLDGRQGFTVWFNDQGAAEFGIADSLVSECIHHGRGGQPAQGNNIPAQSAMAKSAARILAAAPTLRPLYKKIPLGIRSSVKTALYRTSARGRSGLPVTQGLLPATGSFDGERLPGVHLYGYCRSQSGIGQSARGLASALSTLEVAHATTCFENPNDTRERHPFTEIAPPKSGYRISLINANAEQVMALEELIDPNRVNGSYRIAHWVWELSQFPQVWLPALDKIDEIWVPSTFVAEALRAVTQKPVHIIPHIVGHEKSASLTREAVGLPSDRLVFLTAFDINSFISRKNPQATVAAFCDAFKDAGPKTSPLLAIKIHGLSANTDARTVLDQIIGDTPNIVVLDQPMSRPEILGLHALCDVFVSLHRSEGFGLNMADAMAAGTPVIATSYSGNCDFLDETCAKAIPYSLIDVPAGAYPHGEGQVWGEPDHNAAVRAMQTLASDNALRAQLGKAGQSKILDHCGQPNVAKNVIERLNAIDQALN